MNVSAIHSVQMPPKELSTVLASARVSAGFPSPAEGHIDAALDLNELMVRRPAATFFVRVQGDSMTGAGICDGDLLVVDRSLKVRHRDVVLAVVAGDFTVKRWVRRRGQSLLVAEHRGYPAIAVDEQVELWGVVTFAVHPLRPGSRL